MQWYNIEKHEICQYDNIVVGFTSDCPAMDIRLSITLSLKHRSPEREKNWLNRPAPSNNLIAMRKSFIHNVLMFYQWNLRMYAENWMLGARARLLDFTYIKMYYNNKQVCK